MKTLLIFSIILCSLNSFAKDINCHYTNHDNSKGNALISIDEVQVSVKITFDSVTVSASNCKIIMKPTDISVECDEDENSIGVILELINGKFEGVLISEKAKVFGEARC